MFHISSIFYPKHFKQLIAQLKSEGTFRDRPLRELDKTAYLYGIMLIGFNALLLTDKQSMIWPFMPLSLLFLIFICCLSVRLTIKEIIIPYTVGTVQPFLLPDEPSYSYFSSSGGWYINYILYDDTGNLAGEYRARRIPKSVFDKAAFMAAPYEALVVPDVVHWNYPRIPKYEELFRMTTVPLPPPAVPTEDDYI